MSMKMLTILQLVGILAAYLSVTIAAPWILLRKRFVNLKLSVRLMAYFVCGNFYIMNLVFLLQLLHISYRPVLIIGTLFPFAAVAACRFRKSFTVSLEQGTRRIRLISEGEMGMRTQLYRVGKKLQRISSGVLGEWMAPRWTDIVLTLGIIAVVFFEYGVHAVNVFGYCEPDIVVHNYWINEMENNNIFAAGVYPFGFHNVMYYLHEVFRIPTFVLLRVFWLVQTLMIHLVLLFFLRAVCKSKYAAYVGTCIFAGSDFFSEFAFTRYYASLPQEFGMLFILPAVYFAAAFFREGYAAGDIDERERKGKWRRPNLNLTLFAVSVSMTLAVHFYNAIVTALFCTGIAVGFAYRCFRWHNLKRIVAAGITGIAFAVLPLGAAYVMGTPLQESLYWGMDVMSGEEGSTEENTEEDISAEEDISQKESFPEKQVQGVIREISYYMTDDNDDKAWFMLGSTAALFLLGIIWMILKRKSYGSFLLSLSVYMVILFILQDASDFGLPQLIEAGRCRVYITQGMTMVWAMEADAVLFLLLKDRKSIHRASFAALTVVCAMIAVEGIRTPVIRSAQESNGAVVCLTNIIRENQDGDTWTICSANDERQMASNYGNHYELIDFLREMEDITRDSSITIPTKTVYFFVEKEPIFADGENEGRTVSAKGAEKALPEGKKLAIYTEEDRWIVMSRLYYWAQAFQKLYPNEMEVYYETEDFVCYRIRQNEFSLYNFAIDYGYN